MARPSVPVGELYGSVSRDRILQYLDENARRWSAQEIAILESCDKDATIAELMEKLPGRTDLQIRRMMQYLSE